MVQSAASQSLKAWRALGDSPSSGADEAAQSAQSWQLLAAQPGALDLFALRDRDTRQALALIAGPAPADTSDTLAAVFQKALEKSLKAGDLKQAGQILVLDGTAAALPNELRTAYLAHVRIFEAVEVDEKIAVENHQRILGQTTSPACAALAAQRLKTKTGRRK